MADLPTLRIPSDFVDAAVALANLPDATYRTLLSTLSDTDQTLLERAALTSAVVTRSGWERPLVEQLFRMILSLTSAQGHLGVEDPVAVAAAVSRAPELGDSVQPETLAERLAAILQAPTMVLLAKAQDLLSEHDHLFVDARIITDIRPIFDTVGLERIAGAVIGHALRFRLSGAEPQTIDIALDIVDLRSLRDIVDRAIQKEQRLRSLVADSGFPVVMPYDGVDE